MERGLSANVMENCCSVEICCDRLALKQLTSSEYDGVSLGSILGYVVSRAGGGRKWVWIKDQASWTAAEAAICKGHAISNGRPVAMWRREFCGTPSRESYMRMVTGKGGRLLQVFFVFCFFKGT
jgi:hypothetical protein